jgi:hypothetical protein
MFDMWTPDPIKNIIKSTYSLVYFCLNNVFASSSPLKVFQVKKKPPLLLLASSLTSTSKFEQAAALRAPATAEAVRHILVRFILLQYVAQVVIRE